MTRHGDGIMHLPSTGSSCSSYRYDFMSHQRVVRAAPPAGGGAPAPDAVGYTAQVSALSWTQRSRRHAVLQAPAAGSDAARPELVIRRGRPHGLTTTSPAGPRKSTSTRFSTSRPRMRSLPMKPLATDTGILAHPGKPRHESEGLALERPPRRPSSPACPGQR